MAFFKRCVINYSFHMRRISLSMHSRVFAVGFNFQTEIQESENSYHQRFASSNYSVVYCSLDYSVIVHVCKK